jgi:AraC-like DNA-binding protein
VPTARCVQNGTAETLQSHDLTPAKHEGRRGWRAILIYGALIGVEDATYLAVDDEALSLAEVAIGAGFSDQSQLCFHFKRIVGVTPGQFRASAKIT